LNPSLDLAGGLDQDGHFICGRKKDILNYPWLEYLINKRREGNRFVLPLGRLKKSGNLQQEFERQSKSILPIGRLKKNGNQDFEEVF